MAAKAKATSSPAPALVEYHEKAQALSEARDSLGKLFATLQQQLQAATADHMPAIRVAAREVTKQHKELADLIKAKPELFASPRTFITAGMKFGMQKKKGTLTWSDDVKLCRRIRAMVKLKLLTKAQADMAIKVTEKPVSKVLETLSGDLLKRLGVTVGADCDEPLIKAIDSEVEKFINALIAEATGDANAEVTA